jgi:hypothetical protein
MDRFVPRAENEYEMTRHLRPVPDPEQGQAYVIARTQHVRPGTPFVLASCVDRGVAVVFALAGQTVLSRSQMESDPALVDALRAWESKDDSLFRMERKARAAFGRPDHKESLRQTRWHPSRVPNVQS